MGITRQPNIGKTVAGEQKASRDQAAEDLDAREHRQEAATEGTVLETEA